MIPHRQRILLALALSIALHEILIGASGFLKVRSDAPEREAAVTTALILERRMPTPTPRPVATPEPILTPRPTPMPVVTAAARVERAAPKAKVIAHRAGGNHAAKRLRIDIPRTVAHRDVVPVRFAAPVGAGTAGLGTSTAGGTGNGAGSGTGVGDGTGAGSGGGTGGTGTGAANADTPCGEPVFIGHRAKYNRSNGTFAEDVSVRLTLRGGQTLEGDFHYPWIYPSEAENPFSVNFKGDPDSGVAAQLPPAGFDLSKEPTAVQLTLRFTLPSGITRLPSCV